MRGCGCRQRSEIGLRSCTKSENGEIRQKQAAAEFGLSVRWLRKLLVGWRARDDGGLRHGLRGDRRTGEPQKRGNGERWNYTARAGEYVTPAVWKWHRIAIKSEAGSPTTSHVPRAIL